MTSGRQFNGAVAPKVGNDVTTLLVCFKGSRRTTHQDPSCELVLMTKSCSNNVSLNKDQVSLVRLTLVVQLGWRRNNARSQTFTLKRSKSNY